MRDGAILAVLAGGGGGIPRLGPSAYLKFSFNTYILILRSRKKFEAIVTKENTSLTGIKKGDKIKKGAITYSVTKLFQNSICSKNTLG